MAKKRIITEEEIDKIYNFYEDFKKNPLLLKMANVKQHRSSNSYRHACLVSEYALKYALSKKLDIDYYSLIRGSMLHDLYLYDWRKEKNKKKKHLRNHPLIAYKNACKEFDLNKIEQDIILNHMWPITLLHYPKTKEGKIVMWIDKKVTFVELLTKNKSVLIFDLDGTLLDTLKDLNEAVNYAMKEFNYPLRSLEQTRNDIGNGVAKLIARSLPEQEDNPDYQKCLDTFKQYYKTHYNVYTKPFPHMKETLIKLKERGYRLAVVTNKVNDIANDIITTFYPHIFDYVLGEGPDLKKKPAPDMVNFVIKKLKLKRNKIIYIGDTEVDYQTAKNAKVKPMLVTYGYRKRDDLLKIEDIVPLLDSAKDLLNILKK